MESQQEESGQGHNSGNEETANRVGLVDVNARSSIEKKSNSISLNNLVMIRLFPKQTSYPSDGNPKNLHAFQ